ncbi:MAG: hypothetical protein EOM84_04665 [Sphingobacteriia bacterium]|nr:hypothetical protein [Sphingobacteriia bacterium]
MNGHKFLNKQDAESFKRFLDEMKGVEPKMNVREIARDGVAISNKIWHVSTDENLSAKDEIKSRDFINNLATNRKIYLDSAEKSYRALKPEELELKWSQRASMDTDEVIRLRDCLRQTREIDKKLSNLTRARICPQCSKVEDNCTCERSWW